MRRPPAFLGALAELFFTLRTLPFLFFIIISILPRFVAHGKTSFPGPHEGLFKQGGGIEGLSAVPNLKMEVRKDSSVRGVSRFAHRPDHLSLPNPNLPRKIHRRQVSINSLYPIGMHHLDESPHPLLVRNLGKAGSYSNNRFSFLSQKIDPEVSPPS